MTTRPFAAPVADFEARLGELAAAEPDTDRDLETPLPPPPRVPTMPPPATALGLDPDHRPTRPETPTSRSSQRLAAVRPGEPAERRGQPTPLTGLARTLDELTALRADESGEHVIDPDPWRGVL